MLIVATCAPPFGLDMRLMLLRRPVPLGVIVIAIGSVMRFMAEEQRGDLDVVGILGGQLGDQAVAKQMRVDRVTELLGRPL